MNSLKKCPRKEDYEFLCDDITPNTYPHNLRNRTVTKWTSAMEFS